MPASYQNLKNPGIQADFVIRHRQDAELDGALAHRTAHKRKNAFHG
jgi:hypothetical protein